MTEAIFQKLSELEAKDSAADDNLKFREEASSVLGEFLNGLEDGSIRTAKKGADGVWHVDERVKKGILFGFRLGKIEAMGDEHVLPFYDKNTFPVQTFDLERKVRIVPGGTAVRRGSYIGSKVTLMPPAYVNVGAFVDEGTMVDSHALVGSCAQVGKRVHLSAAAQIGGVLEPIGAVPVIIEDDVFIGGNCGIYEGTIVREKAVIAAGVILTSSTQVFDLPNQTVIRAEPGQTLEIPAGAVVVPGSRPAKGEYASAQGLSVYAPIIVKYRDDRTAKKAKLEDTLRS